MKSVIYQNDIELAYQSVVNVSKLTGKSILITGGTGLVGSSVVDLLLKADAKVYLAGRSKERVKNRFGEEVVFVQYDANSEITFDINVDFIIHAASNAHPAAMVAQPVETILSNVVGVGRLLEYAKTHDTTRLLYVSSSEVYGIKETYDPFQENNYGFVDILKARSCYPMGKRAAETLCVSFLSEYGVDSVIVRPGHIYGPTATRYDNRVSSDFAYKAADGNDLVLKSEGTQVRSYTYCLDCASAILTVLLNGVSGEAYNISNRKSIINIRQMAEIYAKTGGVKVKFELPLNSEKESFNPMCNSSLSSDKLEALGWKGVFDAELGLAHTVQIIKEVKSCWNN